MKKRLCTLLYVFFCCVWGFACQTDLQGSISVDDWEGESDTRPLFSSFYTNKESEGCSEHTLEELADWDIEIDADCFIQWSKAVANGDISPENSREKEPEESDPVEEDSVIIFTSQSENFYDVVFSHSVHIYWLGCNGCHYGRRIFIPLRGANPITMQKISEGEYCGVCHGLKAKTDAFHIVSNDTCPKCHSLVIKKGPLYID